MIEYSPYLETCSAAVIVLVSRRRVLCPALVRLVGGGSHVALTTHTACQPWQPREPATRKLLGDNRMAIQDVDVVEINEAFA
jgi:hypothetical protein